MGTTTTEREPLLNDVFLMGIEVPGSWTAPYTNDQLMHLMKMRRDMSGAEVRTWYEDLVTSGKLKVVAEVEYEDQCSKCGNSDLEAGGRVGGFCPGCGNPIKK